MLPTIKTFISDTCDRFKQVDNGLQCPQNTVILCVVGILKVGLLVIMCMAIGHLISSIRNPYLIASTQDLLNKLRKSSVLNVCIGAIKNYLLYLVVGLLILVTLCVSTYSIYKNRKEQSSQERVFERQRNNRLVQIISFMVLFYAMSVYLLLRAKQDYDDFYVEFQSGSLKESNNTTKVELFPGFRNYHYLSYRHQTNHLLAHFIPLSKHTHKQSTYDQLIHLIQQQSKGVSTLRSYLMNHRLVHSLTYTLYYTLMAAFLLVSLTLLFFFVFCFKHQFSCPNRQYNSIKQQQTEEVIVNQSVLLQSQNRSSKCLLLSYMIIFCIFAGVCFGCFLASQIFMEIRAGKRYDSTKEQTSLCSFHDKTGGLMINLNYQLQLNVAKAIKELDLTLKHQSPQDEILAVNLQNKIDFYSNLCQILTPYYLKSRQLQLNIPSIFYGHFVALLYVLWQITKIPCCN